MGAAMEIDKIIYQKLHQRRNDKDFQAKLKRLGLMSTYKQELAFFQAMGHLKIPYLVHENLFYNENNKHLILRENIVVMLSFLILVLGLAIMGHSLFYYGSFSVGTMVLEILSGICIVALSMGIILRARNRQEIYNEAIYENIITILDFADCWDKDDINDDTLIRLLSDLKATKTALILAKKNGYLLKDIDLESALDESILEQDALNTWEYESRATDKAS
jgi:uncharacterized membrane protein